jgi:hypothetical protein
MVEGQSCTQHCTDVPAWLGLFLAFGTVESSTMIPVSYFNMGKFVSWIALLRRTSTRRTYLSISHCLDLSIILADSTMHKYCTILLKLPPFPLHQLFSPYRCHVSCSKPAQSIVASSFSVPRCQSTVIRLLTITFSTPAGGWKIMTLHAKSLALPQTCARARTVNFFLSGLPCSLFHPNQSSNTRSPNASDSAIPAT